MDDDAALEALLRPLWQSFPEEALSVQHNMWKSGMRKELYAFRLDLPPPGTGVEATWQQQCNAVELLMLASLARPQSFMRLAREHCPIAFCAWCEVEETQVVPCRLLIALEDKHLQPEYPRWHLDALLLLLSPKSSILDCTDLNETRESLLSMACTPHVRERWETLKIPVGVELHLTTKTTLINEMEHLLELQQLTKNTSSKPADRRANPFLMESIAIINGYGGYLFGQDPTSRKVLDCTQNLLAHK